jgi:hypothetical protein
MNSLTPIDPALFDAPSPELANSPDGHSGYPEEIAAGDTPDVLRDVCGAASRDFPDSLWIEPRDWEDKARENDKNKTWPINYLDRFTNQNPTHECTCHSLRANAEACRNRQIALRYADGPKKGQRYDESGKHGSVWLSPLSVYAEANPGQWGGAGVRQVLEIAARRGMLPEKIQPAEYNLKHALQGTTGTGGINQSRGSWVAVRNFPDGWQETAKWFKPLEVIFPASYEQAVCLVLNGYVVSVGRSGHAVPWCRFLPGQGMEYADSYDVLRYDSLRTVKSAWYWSFSIASMVDPGDWNKPAG